MDFRSPSDDGRPTDPLTPRAALIVPERLRLMVVSGPDRGRELLVRAGTYFVGKAEGCDLLLTDGAVSRRHLELVVTANGILVRDLESKNGSFFGGARFAEVTVGAGAVVTIGQTELRLCADRGPRVEPSTAESFGGLVGRSLVMRELFALLERVAASDAPILIEGETGTGKELAAEAIAAVSRGAAPLAVCDLGAVTSSLIESELFGHVRGAFTGADADRDGAFVVADGGTLFLDEVGELELALQPRLLRVLERRQVKPIGGRGFRQVDVRVIAATNRDLALEVQEGRFRSDLFYRLSVLRVRLPPLRDRKEDVPLLLDRFIVQSGADVTVSADARALLADYDWPGNVRELKNVVRRALSLLGEERVITPRHLGIADQVVTPERFHEAKQSLVAEWEIDYLRRLLVRTGGNMTRAARIAGLERAYLYRLVKKHGLRADEDEG
ncbi:MAG: response regulator HsfA [Myxococcales bacterium]|nr:response regulator HsfA [Myxococcales bacterium]